MSKKKIVELISGYENADVKNTQRSRFFSYRISGSFNERFGFGYGKFMRMFDKFSHRLAITSARAYGALLLVFGFLSLAVELINSYLNHTVTLAISSVIMSIACILVSVALLTQEKGLADSIKSKKITDYIFHEFFCIPRMREVGAKNEEKGISLRYFVLIGLLMALPTVYVSNTMVLLVALAIVFIYMSLISPEFSFLMTFLAMPYMSIMPLHEVILSCMVGVTLISFLRKVSLGKRVYFFEKYDLLLFGLLLFILISGIFIKGMDSFLNSLVMILLAVGYVLTSSFITNQRLADCVIKVVIISSVPVSVVAIIQFIRNYIVAGNLANTEAVRSTFKSPSVLSVFLIVVLLFGLYFMSQSKDSLAKFIYFLILVLNLFALFATRSVFAFAALLLSVITYVAQSMHHGAKALVGICAAIPYTFLFLPERILRVIEDLPVLSNLGFGKFVSRWMIGREMLLDNLFFGIGIGDDCFTQEIPKYSENAAYTDVSNFLLEIACEAGIFALVLLLYLFWVRIVHRSRYRHYVKHSGIAPVAKVASAVVFALFIYGSINYIWADMSMYYLFWCAFGMGSATLRIARQEYDDRVDYYNDGRRAESASVDIDLGQ